MTRVSKRLQEKTVSVVCKPCSKHSCTDVTMQLQYLKDFVLQSVGLPSNQHHRQLDGMETDSTGFLLDLDTSTHLTGAQAKGQGLGILPAQVIFFPSQAIHL